MAEQKLQLTVKINSETGQLEVVGAKLGQIGQQAEKTGGSFKGLTGEAGALLRSFLPFATAGGILAFFASAVKGAEEENEAFRRLKFTMDATSQSWAKNEQAIRSWTQQIQETTRFSDTQAIQTLDKLTRATGNLSQGQAASRLAMNLSVASGKSLEETTRIVTDLVNNQSRALIQVNREFGSLAGGATTAQQALDNLSKSTADAAVEEESLTSASAKLANKFGEFKDTVGNALAGPLSTLIDWATDAIKKFEQLGIILTGEAAKIAVTFQQIGIAIGRALTLDFSGANQAMKNLRFQTDAINAEVESDFIASEQRKTAAANIGANERILIAKKAALEEIKERAKATADAIKDEIKRIQFKQKAAEARSEIERFEKFQTLELAAETLAVLNSMSDAHNKSEVTRAKAILTLEKAIAVARILSSPQATANPGLAAAQVALITAQFAQQFRAIDKAAETFQEGQRQAESFRSIQLPGGGEFREGASSGGGFSGGGSSFSGGGGGGGAGGGVGQVVNINFSSGSIVVIGGGGNIDQLADLLGEKIIERIRGRGDVSFTR